MKKNSKETKSDSWLINSYRTSRDKNHIGELFTRYLHLVYGVCLKWVNDRQLAEDACMGVMEQLLRSSDNIDEERFKYWLFGLTNEYCQYFLKEKDKIGFLKEEVNRDLFEHIVIEKPYQYSERQLWQLVQKGRLKPAVELEEVKVTLLARFYSDELTVEELCGDSSMLESEVWLDIKEQIKIVEEFLPEEIPLLKAYAHSEKLWSWEMYLKYFTNEILGKEKNAFERELVADPFEFVAFKGMRLFAGASVGADLESLHRRIHRRTGYEKVSKRTKINTKLLFSIVGGGVFFAFVVYFAINKISFKNNGDEVIPRRIIESTIHKGSNLDNFVFKHNDAQDSGQSSVFSDPNVVDELLHHEERDTKMLEPVSLMPLRKISINHVSSKSELADIKIKHPQPEAPLFSPVGGIEKVKVVLHEELKKEDLSLAVKSVITIAFTAKGEILDVEIEGSDDKTLLKEVTEILKRKIKWELTKGTVEEGKEYIQQIMY